MFSIRTDLAMEAREMLKENAEKKEEIDGIEVETTEKDHITVTKVMVKNQLGQEALGKPVGTYVTIESPQIKYSIDEYEETCRLLAEEIRQMAHITEDSTVLVVGLGNDAVTPDALGPKVVSQLMVTRHIKEHMPQYVEEGIRSVCAVAPGVLGTTGIETVEIVEGVVECVKPDCVIAVDALASRSIDRISTTIQVADTGISPGAGIGNNRKGLNEETLGVKVIAIGVPTVVDAATIACDSIDIALRDMEAQGNGQSYEALKTMDDKYQLIAKALSENIGTLMVTPKDVDLLIDKVSKTVANGINMALHKDLTFDDIESYVG